MPGQPLRRTSSPIALAGLLASALLLLAAPGIAAAHSEDGRLPGMPDRETVGNATYRYLPGQGEYEISRPGHAPTFIHGDLGPAALAESPGAGQKLPLSELAPICRSSGYRTILVYTHRPSDTKPTPSETLRSIARRMNWKINSQASTSSSGNRLLKLALDCSGGTIDVYGLSTSDNQFTTIANAVHSELGYLDTGETSVRYLVFDSETLSGIAGVAEVSDDATKSRANKNVTRSQIAVIYGASWEYQTTIHELMHTLGAAQGKVFPAAPHSTSGHHCSDGLDVLCYEDGSGGGSGYTEETCSKFAGFETPETVPIDCNYDTYFSAAPASGTWLAEHWDVAGPEDPLLAAPPKASTEAASAVSAERATLRAAINPEGTETKYQFEYGTTTSYGSISPVPGKDAGFGGSSAIKSADVANLKPTTTYHFRAVASNDAGTVYGADRTFTTGVLPGALTEAAGEVRAKHAALNGSVNPNGISTTYRFEYGTTTSYGSRVPASINASAGSGSTWVGVSQTASGLTPNTTYHFRLVAINGEGTAFGADQTFTTPPSPLAITGSATGITRREATLNGTVNPEGLASTYRFEYGPTTAYGTSIPVPDESVGSGEADIAVSKLLQGLSDSTTYHYRVVATNSDGTTYGKDASFTTAAPKWSLQSISEEPAGKVSNVSDVACPSAGSCTMIATRPGSGASWLPFAERWNGSKWALQSMPEPSGALLSFDAVGCGSAEACMAVGNYEDGSYSSHPFAERWDGSKWSLQSIPKPEEGGGEAAWAQVEDVSCASAEACMAVGTASSGNFAASWSGAAWSAQSIVLPEGAGWGYLEHVSCTSSVSCTALGTYEGSHGFDAFAERWDGSKWSPMAAMPWPGKPEESWAWVLGAAPAISCTSPEACTALLHFTNYLPSQPESVWTAARWDGSNWTLNSMPEPSSAEGTMSLEGLSCGPAGPCMAVGSMSVAAEGTAPVSERWNSSSWSVQEMAKPSSGSTFPSAVSCASLDICTGVGVFEPGESTRRILAERWD